MRGRSRLRRSVPPRDFPDVEREGKGTRGREGTAACHAAGAAEDIVRLENQLRGRGITGQRAHKYLIYLFFMALYEDQRGVLTRATRQGFLEYRDSLSNAAK